MKRFKGQKIQEGSDFMRIPSLTLTADELSTIPDPPSFEDFAINTKEASSDPLSVRKHNNRNISKGKLSKTIRFQHRLSSIASGYSSDAYNEVGVAKEVEIRSSSVKVRKYTPTMNKLVEEKDAINDYNMNNSLQIYHTQLQHSAYAEPEITTQDFLYGDNHQEEQQILNKRLTSNNQTTETFKTANELLMDEIVDSYKNDYMDIVDQYYQPSDKIVFNLPSKLQDKGLVLHPPIPMLNRSHQHSTSIHTASDMSTLPEKLFSSPEIENRSCASSVYSEISNTEYTDEDEELKRETIHKNIYQSEIPDLTNEMNIIDEYDHIEDDIDFDENINWTVKNVQQVHVPKPKMLKWENEFDSSDDDEDIISFEGNRVVSAISGNNYTYMRHLEYVDDSSAYEDEILSEYSERTSFTTTTTTTFNSKEFYEAHDYIEVSIEKE